MNKRIQELAEQAKASVPPGLVVSEWIGVYNQLFAELIVRECLSYAKDGDLDFMKFMIKKNFGVE